jgi:hypothetical protein
MLSIFPGRLSNASGPLSMSLDLVPLNEDAELFASRNMNGKSRKTWPLGKRGHISLIKILSAASSK